MEKRVFVLIIFEIVFGMFLIGGVSAADITACGNIGTGSHILINDITGISGDCFIITASNVILDFNGYKIVGQGTGYAITINNRNSVTIKNGEIDNFNTGIDVDSGSGHKIINMSIKSSAYRGIFLGNWNTQSSGNLIEDCTIIQDDDIGISLTGSSNIINNNIINNADRGIGVVCTVTYCSTGNIITNNKIKGNHKLGVYYGIGPSFSSIVKNNQITNFFYGIALSGDSNTVENNIISENSHGIWLWAYSPGGSANNDIINNTLSNNIYTGLFLSDTPQNDNNNIRDNQIHDNGGRGIYVGVNSNGNTIQNNNISYNGAHGIQLSSVNNVNGNDVYCNGLSFYDISCSVAQTQFNNNVCNKTTGCGGSCLPWTGVCWVIPLPTYSCSSPDDIIMKLYTSENSHGALWDDADYSWDICYSDIFGPYTGDLATVHDCSGTNKFLGLYSVSNSHAEIPEATVYTNDVCYGDLECSSITSGTCSDLGVDYQTIVSLYDTTNSHISAGDFAGYDVKICCKLAPTGNIYWADMQENPIIDAELGDSVLMIVEDTGLAQGTSVIFEIYEDDLLFDDNIRTGSDAITGLVDANGNAIAKWTILQTDLDKTSDLDNFIFKANSLTSNELSIDVIEANFPPLTQIIKPVAETDYVIRQGQVSTNTISFEQISSDVDDDLKITWNFGDSASAEFENCLSGTNCNTTHQYTSPGTRNIILTANEMAPRIPAQFIKDFSRIYVYGEGITAFVVMDYVVNQRMVTIDATQTHVSDCDYVQATCEGKYGGGNCYQVIDEINSADFVWCYDLTLRVDGIDSDPNLFLDWTVNGIVFTPNRVGTGMKYIKIFDQPGDYIINLGVRYKL